MKMYLYVYVYIYIFIYIYTYAYMTQIFRCDHTIYSIHFYMHIYKYTYIYILCEIYVHSDVTSIGLSTKKNEVAHLLQLQWWKLKKLRLMRTHFFACTPFGGRNHGFMVRKFSKKELIKPYPGVCLRFCFTF